MRDASALAPTLTVTPDTAATSSATTGESRDAHVALVIGEQLGRYEIRGYLGEGGMGAVYRAFDSVLGQEVALKVVRGAYADQATLRDEVRVAQKVTHPNVCRTFDLVDVDGRHVVKMEYIAGETLAQRIAAHGAMPIGEAIRIGRAIRSGLAAAHAQGIVHRDLKPGNVMLAGDRVVLMDFGLARAIADGPGDRAGTPSYMSPEQLAGSELDGRSDLFALGCLVFEMVAGKRAYPGDRGSYSELASSRTEAPRPDARALRRDTPRWLARSITELLARDPAARPAGARRLERGPRRAMIAGFAIGLAMIAAAIAWWVMRPPPVWKAKGREVFKHVGNADEPRLSPDGQTVMFSADPGNVGRWAVFTMPLRGGHHTQISRLEDDCVYGRFLADGRAVGMHCGKGSEARLVRRTIGDTAVPEDLGPGLHIEPCGETGFAITSNEKLGSAIVLREADGRERVLARAPFIGNVRCTRDGTRVLYIKPSVGFLGGPLTLIERDGTETELLPRGVLGAAFTPGDRSVVVAYQDGDISQLVELDLETRVQHVLTPDEKLARAPEVSADGKTLIYHRDSTSLPLYEVTATGGREPRTFQRERFTRLAPVRDAALVIATRSDRHPRSIVAIAVDHGTSRTLAEGDRGFPSDDGKRVLWWRDGEMVLHATPIAGGDASVVARVPGVIIDGADGPDGIHLLLKVGETFESWRVTSAGELVREGIAGIVFTAPAGGWRMVKQYGARSTTLQFFAPGQPVTGTPAFERDLIGRPAWVDATHASYCGVTTCEVIDVVTLEVTSSRPNPERHGDDHLAASPDGKRYFITPAIAQVTLIEITNFADRPWKR